MGNALGLIEVFGMTTALVAADAACKSSNVVIETFDKNKPANADKLEVPLLVLIKIRGTVSDVIMGVESAVSTANKISGVYSKSIITRPDDGIKGFLKESCIK